MIKTAWNHIRRSPYQALAAILIMMLTFLALSAFTLLIVGSSIVINYFESKPQVTAFFKDDAKLEEIDGLVASLKQNPHIASVKFVSKKDALAIYRKQNKDDPLLLDLVSEDVLPASVEVSAQNVEDLNGLSVTLKNTPIVQTVVYQQDVVSSLANWTNAIRKIGVVIIAILLFVSIFIMATIIGFRISQKREEIEIMRLLSATNSYVRGPFIIEGMFYGVIGAIIGWAIASGGLLAMSPFLNSFLHGIPVVPVSPLFLLGMLGGEFILALGLGSFASYLAVLRYLK